MGTPFPFELLLVFGFLSIMLLAGLFLRAKVTVLQNFLFPGCLVGGVLGLILINTGTVHISSKTLQAIAYHLFNISFISVGLTSSDIDTGQGGHGKEIAKGSVWMALTQGITFPLQAVIGGLTVALLSLFGLKLFSTFGFLLPLGFNEGPGEALSFGKVWEGIGFQDAATIGLGFATMGYLFSLLVGVPLVNWGIRKGYSAHGGKALPKDFLIGIVSKTQEKEKAGELTIHSGNTDTLAFQMAMVGLIYVITYFFVKYLGRLLPADVAKMMWGFFFFFGLGFALCVKWVMNKLGWAYLLDPGIQRRITGWSVDFLIVATVAAIQVLVVWKYVVPFFGISLVGGILTTLVVVYLGKRLPSYNLERMAAIYGTVTGTVSCGLLLLRIADPEFRTPVAIEIAIMNVFAVPVVGGGTILINGPIWWNWSVLFTTGIFFAIMLASAAAIRALGLWGKRAYE